MQLYPLFMPDEELAVIGVKNWKKKEAKQYFDWFIQIKQIRVVNFLKYIDIELTGNNEFDLQIISNKLYNVINNPRFYNIRESDGLKQLNNEGLAMATDMGLLLAQLVEDACPTLFWEIAKGPKSYHSYNLPVLKEFIGSTNEVDLVFLSIVKIGYSLNILKAPFNWNDFYINLKNTVK